MEKDLRPRGIRNNNPLNIRKGVKWLGLSPVPDDGQFCRFDSMLYGFRAAFTLLRNYITGQNSAKRHFDTPAAIISRWAPPSENATSLYIQRVADYSGLDPHERLDWRSRSQMCALVAAMARVECGQKFDAALIESAFDLLITT